VVKNNFISEVIIILNGTKQIHLNFFLKLILFFRGSGQNSRASSVADSTTLNTEGFSNYTEIIQHLQTG
jgi:hypothetical protein